MVPTLTIEGRLLQNSKQVTAHDLWQLEVVNVSLHVLLFMQAGKVGDALGSCALVPAVAPLLADGRGWLRDARRLGGLAHIQRRLRILLLLLLLVHDVLRKIDAQPS